MGNKYEQIYMKNCKYYLFDDTINIKNLDFNKIMIDEKSYKNIPIYYIEYVTCKNLKNVKMNSVNPLYLIIIKTNGYFDEINRNIYI